MCVLCIVFLPNSTAQKRKRQLHIGDTNQQHLSLPFRISSNWMMVTNHWRNMLLCHCGLPPQNPQEHHEQTPGGSHKGTIYKTLQYSTILKAIKTQSETVTTRRKKKETSQLIVRPQKSKRLKRETPHSQNQNRQRPISQKNAKANRNVHRLSPS